MGYLINFSCVSLKILNENFINKETMEQYRCILNCLVIVQLYMYIQCKSYSTRWGIGGQYGVL